MSYTSRPKSGAMVASAHVWDWPSRPMTSIENRDSSKNLNMKSKNKHVQQQLICGLCFFKKKKKDKSDLQPPKWKFVLESAVVKFIFVFSWKGEAQ